jgi:hypothetical protein
MINSEKMKNSFALGLVLCGISIIFLGAALFCQFYSITRGTGEYAVTVFPYTQYVLYAVEIMTFTLVIGIGGLIIGRETKENEMFMPTVLPEELKGEKRKANKLRVIGYGLYGVGLAIFIIGLLYSYLEATNNLSTSVLEGKSQLIFLNTIIPWIVVAIILWAIATLPITLSYRHEETRVTS